MRRSVEKYAGVSLFMVAVAIGSPSSAQTGAATQPAESEDAAGSPAGIDDIVVTANRRSESLQSTPLTITALGGEQLIDRGVTSSLELQKVTPGLFYGNNGGFAQPYIRGVGTSITVPGAESSVATFIDDVYQSQPFFTIQSLNAIERVEVLKGPQGVLYGRNATGGAIRIQTKNPSDRFETDHELTYGNYDQLRYSGYVSVPLSDGLAANLAVVLTDRDGFGRILNGTGRVSSEQYASFRGKLSWQASDNLGFLLTGYYFNEHDRNNTTTTYSDRFGSIPTAVGLGGKVTYYSQDIYSSYPIANAIEAIGGNLRTTLEIGDVTITSVTALSKLSYLQGGDFLSASIPIFNFQARDGGGNGFYQTLEAVGAAGALEWVVGGSYTDDEGRFDTLDVFVGPNLATQTFAQVSTRAYALYARASYDLTDRLNVTAGLRYTDERKRQDRIEAFNAAGVRTSLTPPSSRSWSRVTWQGLLKYQLDDIMLYGKIETGFKSGTVNTLVPGGYIDPETITSYEAGIKSDLLDRRLRINLSGFFYRYKNLQQQYNDVATGSSLLESAERARVYGGELQIEAAPTERLRLTASTNLMRGTFIEFDSGGQFIPRAATNPVPPGGSPGPANAGNIVTRLDVSGNRMMRAPDVTGTVSATYTVPFASGAKLDATASYYYSSKVYFDATNRIAQPAYGLLDARLTYHLSGERVSLALWGRNLTDETYISGSALSANGDQIRIGAPRQYGVTARYAF